MWGFWSFIPKITTRYLSPNSAIVYESLGGLLFVMLLLASIKFQVQVDARGTSLAIATGMLGVAGAFLFLNAVARGPVTLVATISALYPVLTVFLAIAILHETLTLRQTIGILFAIVSVLLIAV